MALTINRLWRPPERNVRTALPYDCDAPCTMTNRSDRRWQNPERSTCHEHDTAIGSQRATSSSRPSILRSEGGGGRIYVCSRHGRQSCGMLATGEESIYGPYISPDFRSASSTGIALPSVMAMTFRSHHATRRRPNACDRKDSSSEAKRMVHSAHEIRPTFRCLHKEPWSFAALS